MLVPTIPYCFIYWKIFARNIKWIIQISLIILLHILPPRAAPFNRKYLWDTGSTYSGVITLPKYMCLCHCQCLCLCMLCLCLCVVCMVKGTVFYFFPGHERWSFIHAIPKIVFYFFSDKRRRKNQVVFFFFSRKSSSVIHSDFDEDIFF